MSGLVPRTVLVLYIPRTNLSLYRFSIILYLLARALARAVNLLYVIVSQTFCISFLISNYQSFCIIVSAVARTVYYSSNRYRVFNCNFNGCLKVKFGAVLHFVPLARVEHFSFQGQY